MSIKITIPNTSSDVLTFGSANTPTAAQIAGIDSGSSNGQLALYTTASGTSTERIRVDASGNVGVGTSSPSAKFQVAGDVRINTVGTATTGLPIYAKQTNNDQRGIWTESATTDSNGRFYCDNSVVGIAASYSTTGSYLPITFTTSATERMRIDSSGNLLVGTTTVYGRGTIQSSGSSDAICGSLGGSNNGYSTFIGRNVSGTATFYVTGAGQISAVSTSITAISDARLKTNIQPIKYGLDTITALKPVMYDFIENDLVQGQPDNLGFIAQDVKEVVPELVSEGQNKAEDDTSYLTLKMGDMLPILVKAIQEQQALITQLQADVAALKGASA